MAATPESVEAPVEGFATAKLAKSSYTGLLSDRAHSCKTDAEVVIKTNELRAEELEASRIFEDLGQEKPPAIIGYDKPAADQDRRATEMALAKRRIELLENIAQQQRNLVVEQREQAADQQRQLQEQAKVVAEVQAANARCEEMLRRMSARTAVQTEDL